MRAGLVLVGNILIWLLVALMIGLSSKLRGGFGEVVYVVNAVLLLGAGRFYQDLFNRWMLRGVADPRRPAAPRANRS